MLGSAVRTGEQCIFAIERDGTDRALDHVGVDFDAAIIDEAREAFPARQGVADRFGQFDLLTDRRKLFAQPGLERIDNRPATLLARHASRFRISAADLVFDGVERADPRQRLAGDRRRACGCELVEATADMRPAEGELDPVAGKSAIAGVTVDLQDADKIGEMSLRPLRSSIRRVDIGDGRRVRSAPWSIVSRIGPELTGLGATPAGIKDRRGRFVGEDFRRRADMRQKALIDRAQMPGGAADPISERRAIEIDALAAVNLSLAIKWQVVGVFG